MLDMCYKWRRNRPIKICTWCELWSSSLCSWFCSFSAADTLGLHADPWSQMPLGCQLLEYLSASFSTVFPFARLCAFVWMGSSFSQFFKVTGCFRHWDYIKKGKLDTPLFYRFWTVCVFVNTQMKVDPLHRVPLATKLGVIILYQVLSVSGITNLYSYVQGEWIHWIPCNLLCMNSPNGILKTELCKMMTSLLFP